MGFRTVVILNNDLSSTWQNDENLGKKISEAASYMGHSDHDGSIGNIGQVVECVHADSQSLVTLHSLGSTLHAASNWRSGQTQEERDLALLKQMADKMGYSIVKKPVK